MTNYNGVYFEVSSFPPLPKSHFPFLISSPFPHFLNPISRFSRILRSPISQISLYCWGQAPFPHVATGLHLPKNFLAPTFPQEFCCQPLFRSTFVAAIILLSTGIPLFRSTFVAAITLLSTGILWDRRNSRCAP